MAAAVTLVAPSRSRVSRLATEQAAAQAAFGIVALHVVDDAFLQREPGTSISDHLASGLVPLALLVGAAVALRRARAGVRGAVALLAGFFGLLQATEAGYYGANGGLAGDDWTGVLSGVAAVFLLAVGVRTLWRSRRTDDGRVRRYARRAGIAIAIAAFAQIVLLPTSVAYVVTHTARAAVPVPHLGAPAEDVSFTTSDGLRLHGWFVPSRNGATVIAVPGRKGPQAQARMLVRHGYGVLLFDRRGEGESDGDPNIFGWHGERDLDAAAAYLRSRADVDPARIGGIGLSVGGEMLIHAAAQSDAFKAIVTEGASGQSFRDDVANGSWLDAALGGAPVTLATAVFTNDLPPTTLRSDVERMAPRPVLFMYGEHGQGGTERGPNHAFYALAHGPKELWEIPDAQHVAGIRTHPREYERRVVGFFDRYL